MNEIKPMYTAEDFYNFFEAIPEEQWTQDVLNKRGCHCALYWLGARLRPIIAGKELIEGGGEGYYYFPGESIANVIRLANLLGNKRQTFHSKEKEILSINDNLDTAVEVLEVSKDFNLLDLKPRQKAKLAKANMLNALKKIM